MELINYNSNYIEYDVDLTEGKQVLEVVCLEIDTFISNSIDIYEAKLERALNPDMEGVVIFTDDYEYNGDKTLNVSFQVFNKGRLIKSYDFHTIETEHPMLTIKLIQNAITLRHSDVNLGPESINEIEKVNLAEADVVEELENCLRQKMIINNNCERLSNRFSFLNSPITYVENLIERFLDYKWKNLLSL